MNPGSDLHRVLPEGWHSTACCPVDGDLKTDTAGRSRHHRTGFLQDSDGNADDYARSRLNAGELEPRYCNQMRSLADVSELKVTAWLTNGQIFLHHQVATVQASTNTGGAAKRSLQ